MSASQPYVTIHARQPVSGIGARNPEPVVSSTPRGLPYRLRGSMTLNDAVSPDNL